MYKADNLSVEMLEEYFRECEEYQMQQLVVKKKEAESYYNGYMDAMSLARGALHCSNYEKK